MNSLLTNHWLLLFNSIVFWLTPIVLAINLALIKNKSNTYKKKIAYLYGSLWAIAFSFYLVIFIIGG